jgi:ATP-dependent RNA helicase DeaD
VKTFDELSLSPALAKSITEMGFSVPSPIQAQALPILLKEPTDFIGLAATGTGKTAAFSIPMIEQVDPSILAVQTLILCPTRELALQVAGQINMLGKHKGVRAMTIYGGAPYGDQLRGLKAGTPIVVGTPGRIVDHIEKGSLKLNNLKVLILDEADEMISMGFKDELDVILGSVTRETTKIWLFSATMSPDVRRVADKYLTKPQQVQVNKTEMLSSTVNQLYYVTRESNKPEVLCKLIEAAADFYGVIFCQTKSLVTDLTQYLTERGYKVDCLHGDKDQRSRERTMQAFRDHKVNVLICTDVASRGLDVKDITHVINYSLPRELDSYVHRIGRTARSGKTGFAMSLVTPSHMGILRRIENLTKSRVKEGVIPSRREIGSKKISSMLSRFVNEKFAPRAVEVMDDTWKESINSMSKEEIAGRFLAMMNPDVFSETDRAQMPGPRPSADQDREPRRYGRDSRSGGRDNDRGGYGDRRGGDRGSDRGGPRRSAPRDDSRPYRPRRDSDDLPPRRQDFERSEKAPARAEVPASTPVNNPVAAPAEKRSAYRSEPRAEARTERPERRERSVPRFDRPEQSGERGGERSPRRTNSADSESSAPERKAPPKGVTYGRMPKRFEEKSKDSGFKRSGFRERTPHRTSTKPTP